jgi:sigma-B regulation protein RsbU (phosphoserine phosphatase)
VAYQLFWAMMNKLSPARRVLLLVALVLLLISGTEIHSNNVNATLDFRVISALLLLLLLSLELADKVTMKRDLEIAREIQSWLVPSEPPVIANAEVAFATKPQNSVAGDYYDAFYPLKTADDPGKLMLVMADVAGKSVPAALLMATLQASLRTIASEGAPLDQLAQRLNHYACDHSLGGQRFTTAVIGEFDPVTRQLAYVNAGHNAPVVRRANGAIERLESCSLPLGIHEEATFPAAQIQLTCGDTLILFTDGVIEAFNAAGEEFSDPRWINAIRSLPNLPAQGTLETLMKYVNDFAGATRQSDDITCLILQIK